MRRYHAGGTVLNLRVDIKDGDLSLGAPLLLVEVGHHVLDPCHCLLKQTDVRMLRVRAPEFTLCITEI